MSVVRKACSRSFQGSSSVSLLGLMCPWSSVHRRHAWLSSGKPAHFRTYRKARRLLEHGFETPGANEAILRLRAQQEDTQATQDLEQEIAAHPGVRVADEIIELYITSVDEYSPPEHVLQQLRRYFRDACDVGAPGHTALRRLGLHTTTPQPAEAVLSVRKLPRRGCAMVEVANTQVAEFFCSASYHRQQGDLEGPEGQGGINCAPLGDRPRCVNIHRSARRRRSSVGASGASEAVLQDLEVVRVSVVDLDARERRPTVVHRNGKRARGETQYPARTLWDCNIEEAGIDLKSRSIELEQCAPRESSKHLVRLSIELRTVKRFSIFYIQGETQHCLALRLRRPPTLSTAPAPAEVSSLMQEALAAIRSDNPTETPFACSTDVSDCEAFSSPTAWLCLHFDGSDGSEVAEKTLQSFKIQMGGVLSVCMHGSKHEKVCTGVSHELPMTLKPLTERDLAAAGDGGFEVSFLLDLLLVHGHLRAADVPAVLGMLRCLREWGYVRSFREFLGSLAEEAADFHRCNDGDSVHTRGHIVSTVVDMTREGNGAVVLDLTQEDEGVPGGGGGVPEDVEAAEDDELVLQRSSETEEGIIYPRRVIVTPLRVLLYAAVPEVSNRILRRYSRFKDRFLRVSFANERLGPTSHMDLSEAVCHRIRTLLLEGLTVGNRRFVFLAFSNSQLREHGCWLYCEDDRAADGAPSADAIRQSVGDLSALRVASKYAARLGQGFSTTFETFRFQPHEICEIPDVCAPNGDLFSDGVGVITGSGMQKVVQRLPTRMRRRLGGALPSAIQIRLGGCKGMLALWDGVPGMRPGALVGIRPSMKKFESPDLAVEVCSLARPMPAAINRQLIMALLSLGIDSAVFDEMYHTHVMHLDKLVSGGAEALSVLRAMGAYAAHGLHGVGVAQGSLAACMIEAGISPRDDLLLLSICQAFRTYALKSVTDKCRIALKDGVNLIGVMDESGALPEGTFWAQWDRTHGRRSPTNPHGIPDSKALPPGTRTVVSRFPCISPADVRVLRAADPSTLPAALTALTNVVVFPRVGDVPEPCTMSGGDLDGDIYLLTWDPALVPDEEAAAVDYTPDQAPAEAPEGVTVADIVDFQINYMKNDQLGRIANGHLAIADFAEDIDGQRAYANNDKCDELVHLHSTAVDFAKTGVPVRPSEVTFVLKGAPVPDYLGGPDRSTSAIGEITRAAKERTAATVGLLAGAQEWRLLRHADRDLLVHGRHAFRQDAQRMLDDWIYDIGQLMHRFGVEDVGEVFSGRVRQFHGRAAGREKQAEHQKQLDTALAAIVENYQRWWFPDVEPSVAPTAINSDSQGRLYMKGPGRAANAPGVGRQQPLQLEPGTLQEMLCAASALYDTSYREDGRLCMQEHLIRRACPWRVAPRLLLQLKLWASQQTNN